MAAGARSGWLDPGEQSAERRCTDWRIPRASGVGWAYDSVVERRLPPRYNARHRQDERELRIGRAGLSSHWKRRKPGLPQWTIGYRRRPGNHWNGEGSAAEYPIERD